MTRPAWRFMALEPIQTQFRRSSWCLDFLSIMLLWTPGRVKEIDMKRMILMMGLLAFAGGLGPRHVDIDPGTGPPGIGDSLAALTGLDQSGVRRTAASLVGREGAVVTFLRSADWCPSCKVQLVEFEAARAALTAAGYGLAGVTIDEVPVLAKFAAERKIGFPLIAGRTSIAGFGMIDPRFDADEGRQGAPVP